MKRFYLFIAIFIFFAYNFSQLQAKVITVTATSGNQFTPQTISDAVVGDTIMWIWSGGTHTTTSLSIPGEATAWDAPLSSTTTSFSYKISVAGTYTYKCTPHYINGMTGGFYATDPTGTKEEELSLNVSAVLYPNPFKDKVIIHYNDADAIAIYNMIGEKIKSFELEATQTKAELNLGELPVGVYFYSTVREGVIAETKRIVKSQ